MVEAFTERDTPRYLLSFLGGWIEQFGAITQTLRAVNVGVIASVLIPSEALWRRAAFEMQSPLANATRISPGVLIRLTNQRDLFFPVVALQQRQTRGKRDAIHW